MAERLLVPRKKRKINPSSQIIIAPRANNYFREGKKSDLVNGRVFK